MLRRGWRGRWPASSARGRAQDLSPARRAHGRNLRYRDSGANRLKKLVSFHFGRLVRLAIRTARAATTSTYLSAAVRSIGWVKSSDTPYARRSLAGDLGLRRSRLVPGLSRAGSPPQAMLIAADDGCSAQVTCTSGRAPGRPADVSEVSSSRPSTMSVRSGRRQHVDVDVGDQCRVERGMRHKVRDPSSPFLPR